MAGIAIIAKQLGHEVTGSDKNLYDPMKSVLKKEKINFTEGYNTRFLKQSIDLVIVGNVMSRGMDIIERLLDSNIKYISGPQWLYENVLSKKYVIAVFEEDELPIAIGRNGQNIKLVSSITGYTVDAISVNEYSKKEANPGQVEIDSDVSICSSGKVSEKIGLALASEGIVTFQDFLNNIDKAKNIKGLGPKTIEKIERLANF